MSWSLSVQDRAPGDLYIDIKTEFARVYPDPAEGVLEQVDLVRAVVHEFVYTDVFEGDNSDNRYNVQASGHVSDGDSETFVSVILTKRYPQEAADDPAED